MTTKHLVFIQFSAIVLILVQFSVSNGSLGNVNTKPEPQSDERDKTQKTSTDSRYYKSEILVDKTLSDEYWSSYKNFTVNDLLSKSHRRAFSVRLTFDFPFYGAPVRLITVANGGFVFTGDYIHSWLAASQYIAPLLLNFDATLSNVTTLKYADNGTAFTVIWEKVPFVDTVDHVMRLFTFSVTLYESGDITFAYRNIPVAIDVIKQGNSRLRIGLSDAYLIERARNSRPHRTIYEYDRLSFKESEITNHTLIYLTPKPNCLQLTSCEECVSNSTEQFQNFECKWCPAVKRCSAGLDRKRQEWESSGCSDDSIANTVSCPVPGSHDEMGIL